MFTCDLVYRPASKLSLYLKYCVCYFLLSRTVVHIVLYLLADSSVLSCKAMSFRQLSPNISFFLWIYGVFLPFLYEFMYVLSPVCDVLMSLYHCNSTFNKQFHKDCGNIWTLFLISRGIFSLYSRKQDLLQIELSEKKKGREGPKEECNLEEK